MLKKKTTLVLSENILKVYLISRRPPNIYYILERKLLFSTLEGGTSDFGSANLAGLQMYRGVCSVRELASLPRKVFGFIVVHSHVVATTPYGYRLCKVFSLTV